MERGGKTLSDALKLTYGSGRKELRGLQGKEGRKKIITLLAQNYFSETFSFSFQNLCLGKAQ